MEIEMTRQYYPSSIIEGYIFQALFCEKCTEESNCNIWGKYIKTDEEPKQWIYDENDEPTCTSFASERPKKKQVKPISDEEMREPIENALYATRRFLTTQATDLADGIIQYLKDAGYTIVRTER